MSTVVVFQIDSARNSSLIGYVEVTLSKDRAIQLVWPDLDKKSEGEALWFVSGCTSMAKPFATARISKLPCCNIY